MNSYTVSIYKKVSDVANAFNKDVFYCLNRIKTGASKQTVQKLRSLPYDEYNKQKSVLPGVCFNGTFKHRSKKGLVKKSGLIILDFDKYETTEEAIEAKNNISKDKYVFAAWLSPSNKGIKVLVKIPKENDNHEGYFNALKKHFNDNHFDDSGKDVSRFCFESYDEELYLNPDSFEFVECEQPELSEIGTYEPIVALKSDNAIITVLTEWWSKKYKMTDGFRNSNLFKLAIALNDFGIQKMEAERELKQYASPGFDEREIQQLIDSAYNKRETFGTKFLEDKESKQKIEKHIRSGKNKKEIQSEFKNIKESEIDVIVQKIKDEITQEDFWQYTKNNKIILSPHKFKFWLQQHNFYKFFPTNANTFTFIKVEQNLIEETSEKKIKDFVLNELLNRTDIGFIPYDYMAANTKYFSSEFLSMLESSDVKVMEDTQDKCYLYYQNCVVEVMKESIKQHDYIDVDGLVWRNRIIDRVYKEHDHHESEFRNFVWLISGENAERYNSFKSVIGYLLHTYKTSANNKAIIFNDETISENPNGGSGKGLFWNSLSKLKKVSAIDGKTFEFTKSFPYQTVSTDTQILVFDDVKKNFNFESLFSLITEGITLEYKGQDAIKLPVQRSPKILITTNYTIGGVGGSFERRKFEIELSDYFSYKHTPVDEFGHLLFDDWDEKEWSRFDNFMIQCVQYYLINGLVKCDTNNIELRKYIKNTSFEFHEWTKEHDAFPVNQKNNKKEFFELLVSEYPDLKKFLSQKRFKIWIENYCKYYGFEYSEGNSAGRWFMVSTGENNVPKEDELNDEAPF